MEGTKTESNAIYFWIDGRGESAYMMGSTFFAQATIEIKCPTIVLVDEFLHMHEQKWDKY